MRVVSAQVPPRTPVVVVHHHSWHPQASPPRCPWATASSARRAGKQIDVEKLHEPDVLYVDMRERLSALSSLLGECGGLEPGIELPRSDFERIGIPPFLVSALPAFLRRFVPMFAQPRSHPRARTGARGRGRAFDTCDRCRG